jgi:AraC-like DNA-binding protein
MLARNQSRRDILTAVMFNCPTLGTAMEKLVHYHDLATDLIKIRIQEEGETAHFAWETPLEGLLDRQISEAVIAWLFFTLQGLSDRPVPVRRVNFRHPEPMDTREHQKLFNCQVTFEQASNEIIVTREILDFPVPLADTRITPPLENILQEQLKALYPPNTWSERVSHFIRQRLLQGEQSTLPIAAREMALSARQLQNKLKAENTSYRKLLEQVRKEIALRYLKEPDVNLYDIAFLLGFSDQSAFTHAFKRWTGTTPGKFQS